MSEYHKSTYGSYCLEDLQDFTAKHIHQARVENTRHNPSVGLVLNELIEAIGCFHERLKIIERTIERIQP